DLNSAIMGAAPKEKLGVAGGILNMMRSLGLIFGVDISGVIFTSLEHRYLAERGYANVEHVFSDANIPLALKDNAFMKGFVVVIGVLLLFNLVATLLSYMNKSADTVDAEARAAAKEFEHAA
ncbi:MAG: hypothetical protein M0017_04935, partial [Desulfobacteraceae bacterium]|nr:hypothetical protein [Desulfobacteraceae bacterium]